MTRNDMLASEAGRLIAAAQESGVPARLLGGLAVYLTCPSTRRAPFAREIADIDFIVTKRRSTDFGRLLTAAGYTGDHQFNSIHGESRLLFTSELTDVDVFVGAFAQCHTLDMDAVLTGAEPTIPAAYLLLTKLQIVQINRKDELDALAVVNDHCAPPGGDGDIDLGVITGVTGGDWGWYTTVLDTLGKLDVTVDALFTGDEASRLHGRLAGIRAAIQASPKSIKWKMRDKVGRRVPWYDLPEEKKL